LKYQKQLKVMILFESFKEIDTICQEYGITNYVINSDGSIDVRGDVDLSRKDLVRFPLRFRKVSGDFLCHTNQLETLDGCPKEVGRDFDCGNNQLQTLEGGPEEVGFSFRCDNNQLVTLEGSPKKVGSDFWCDSNKLVTLEGSPKYVGGDFLCGRNKLETLEGSPKKVNGSFNCIYNNLISLEGGPEEVGSGFYCNNNPVNEIFKLFKDYDQFKSLMDDYNYLRGNRIIGVRFREACIEAGIEMPKKIDGYDIV